MFATLPPPLNFYSEKTPSTFWHGGLFIDWQMLSLSIKVKLFSEIVFFFFKLCAFFSESQRSSFTEQMKSGAHTIEVTTLDKVPTVAA